MVDRYRYPETIDDDANRMHLEIYAHNYSPPTLEEKMGGGNEDGFVLTRESALWMASLYIPSYRENISPNWSSEKIAFGTKPGALQNIFNQDTGIEMFKAGASAVKDIASNMMGHVIMDKIAPTVSHITASLGGIDALESGYAAAGMRFAPNDALIFKGASNLSLPLTFTFFPKNKTEGETMVALIEKFREATMPEIISNVGMTLQFYKYPPLFQIDFVKNNRTVRTGQFVSYKTMALVGFEVSYSDGTDVFEYFSDGIPVSASLGLQFKSIFPGIRKSLTNETTNIGNDGGSSGDKYYGKDR